MDGHDVLTMTQEATVDKSSSPHQPAQNFMIEGVEGSIPVHAFRSIVHDLLLSKWISDRIRSTWKETPSLPSLRYFLLAAMLDERSIT
jgi:hypothetical protein